MKQLFFITFLFIYFLPVKAQNAFYQARYLHTLSTTQLDKILAQTSAVLLSEQETRALNDFKTFLKTPFAADLKSLDINALTNAINKYNALIKVNLNASAIMGTSRFSPAGGASPLALINTLISGGTGITAEQQTMIIDAITKVYAEEFKKAQVLTYMQAFRQTVGKSGELQVLFPQTYSKLKAMDPAKFPDLGDEFKTIFNNDLENLVPNLTYHIDNYSPSQTLPDKTLSLLNQANCNKIKAHTYYPAFKLSADVGSKLIHNYHPVDLFDYIDDTYYTSDLLTNSKLEARIKLIFHGLNLIQRNLIDSTKVKDTQLGNIWISSQELKTLDTPAEWAYFAGLLYQQDENFFNKYIFNATSKATADISVNLLTDDELRLLKTRVTSILNGLQELESFRANLKEENMKDNFAGYMNLLIKVVQQGNFVEGAQLGKAEMEDYLKLSNYAINIYDNARKKNYSNSIHYGTLALKEFLPDNKEKEALNLLEKYSTFMSSAINAKNADELKETIQTNVADRTSFIKKRQYRGTFTITGQPGYFIGSEWLKKGEKKASFVSGITLPMGFELTKKLKYGEESSGSLGLFVQVVDLGAILNFRISDDTSTLPDKITAKQIFSPGVTLNYGVKNSPLTIGFGYQASSELRKITSDGGNESYPSGNRFVVRMAWDLPLLKIATSKKQ